MNDFYTFIITSTINAGIITGVNVFDPNTRFNETLETIKSVRAKVPNVKIIMLDNSTEPLTSEQVETLQSQVDVFKQIDHNIFTVFVNRIGSKGLGEAYLMQEAIKLIEKNSLIGKRIFKITGRYCLADSFDIGVYDTPELIGKYAHKINMWDVSTDNFINHRQRVVYFETRLWSFCGTLLSEYKMLLQKIFEMMVSSIGEQMCNLEICHYHIIPHDKTFELETAHVMGHTADNGVYKFE